MKPLSAEILAQPGLGIFYDLHTLYRTRRTEIRPDILRLAVEHTAPKCGSMAELHDWQEIIEDIRSEHQLVRLWEKYCEGNQCAAGITFKKLLMPSMRLHSF